MFQGKLNSEPDCFAHKVLPGEARQKSLSADADKLSIDMESSYPPDSPSIDTDARLTDWVLLKCDPAPCNPIKPLNTRNTEVEVMRDDECDLGRESTGPGVDDTERFEKLDPTDR